MSDQLGDFPASTEKPNIPNHLVLAIISTVCCGCLPLGIVSIVFSTQVNKHLGEGNIAAAEAASKKAKMFAILSIVIGVLGGLAYGGFMGFLAVMNHR